MKRFFALGRVVVLSAWSSLVESLRAGPRKGGAARRSGS
jgi:hypothetical protein